MTLVTTARTYQSGFGNEFASEAVAGALPRDQNAPQKPPLGLYIEELNGTAFTAPRGVSRSAWTYRIRPSATHKPFKSVSSQLIRSGPFNEVPPTPNQLRWRPMPIPTDPTDFVDGIATLGGNGDPAQQTGAAIHVYAANAPMRDRFFYDADGELLIVPQQGALTLFTELGVLDVPPGHVCVLPRGVKFRVELPDGSARGYICENYGQHLRLPDLGPIGTFGLANARDFEAPVAAFEDREGDFRIVAKYGGGLWEAEIDHSPLDIVAWRGNYVPFRYDLYKFQCINTVTFDHPDPSIYCVLASPTGIPGTSNMELGCFPPRWTVAEHTFRPPPFHRNVASEFLGLISGQYIGKADGFGPGSASLHNCMSGHGPDTEAYERGRSAELKPQYLDDTMVFLFETQLPIRPTKFALETDLLERDYYRHWQGLKKHFTIGIIVLAAWLLTGGIAAAQGNRSASAACDRACLIGVSDQYLAALVAKDVKRLSLASNVKYTENGQRLQLGDGFWNSVSGRGTYTLHAADPIAGQIVTFATMREAGMPMIIAVRLKVDDRRISEVEALIAHSENGAKGFEALGKPHPLFSQIIPLAERMARADLVRVANMYFSGMQLNDGKGQYPFAADCNRFENGFLTTNNPTGGRGRADSSGTPPERPDPKTATNYSAMWSCKEQFESGLLHFVSRIRDRRYVVVDEERGLALAFVFFDHDAGASRTFLTPNGRTVTAGPTVPWTWHIAELFRIEKGLIRQVEAILERAPYGMPSGWSRWEDAMSDEIQWQGR